MPMPRTATQMETEIDTMRQEFATELEALRARYMGKDGRVQAILKELSALSPESRVLVGASLNSLVAFIHSKAP